MVEYGIACLVHPSNFAIPESWMVMVANLSPPMVQLVATRGGRDRMKGRKDRAVSEVKKLHKVGTDNHIAKFVLDTTLCRSIFLEANISRQGIRHIG